MLYEKLLRRVLFRLDAERAHHLVLGLLARTPLSSLVRGRGSETRDPFRQWGLVFGNRLGLAAGFDKNAAALPAWRALGFGFVEIGTVTRHPQPGNPKPRVFRCPTERGLINRLGFPNDGAQVIANRLLRFRESGPEEFPVGANIGKSKVTPNDAAEEDYLFSLRTLYEGADFFVVNVSSPNTPGLRDLQSPELLGPILRSLRDANAERDAKPLLVKIAPDLTDAQIKEIVALVREVGLDGVVATNTTIDHSAVSLDEKGGLSGRPLTAKSTDVIRTIREQSDGELPIVGVGGVFTAADYREKLEAGASLVELYTGFVYEGPRVVGRILSGG